MRMSSTSLACDWFMEHDWSGLHEGLRWSHHSKNETVGWTLDHRESSSAESTAISYLKQSVFWFYQVVTSQRATRWWSCSSIQGPNWK